MSSPRSSIVSFAMGVNSSSNGDGILSSRFKKESYLEDRKAKSGFKQLAKLMSKFKRGSSDNKSFNGVPLKRTTGTRSAFSNFSGTTNASSNDGHSCASTVAPKDASSFGFGSPESDSSFMEKPMKADHDINSPAATQGSPPSYSPYEETWSVASNYESSFMHQRYVPPTPGSPSASTVSRSGRLSSYVSPSYPQYQPAPVNNGEASGIAVSIIVPTLPSARSSYFDSASTASTAGSSRCDLTPGLDTEDATAHGEQLDANVTTATVRETLRFSAHLRQPRDMPVNKKDAYADEILESLELQDFADAMIGSINAETRKRLDIGIELVARPKLESVKEPKPVFARSQHSLLSVVSSFGIASEDLKLMDTSAAPINASNVVDDLKPCYPDLVIYAPVYPYNLDVIYRPVQQSQSLALVPANLQSTIVTLNKRREPKLMDIIYDEDWQMFPMALMVCRRVSTFLETITFNAMPRDDKALWIIDNIAAEFKIEGAGHYRPEGVEAPTEEDFVQFWLILLSLFACFVLTLYVTSP